jgi:hypothetical protein
LKSIHPHKVALAVTPANDTGAVKVVPEAPILTDPANAVVPSSAVIAVPKATESGLVVGFKVFVWSAVTTDPIFSAPTVCDATFVESYTAGAKP